MFLWSGRVNCSETLSCVYRPYQFCPRCLSQGCFLDAGKGTALRQRKSECFTHWQDPLRGMCRGHWKAGDSGRHWLWHSSGVGHSASCSVGETSVQAPGGLEHTFSTAAPRGMSQRPPSAPWASQWTSCWRNESCLRVHLRQG